MRAVVDAFLRLSVVRVFAIGGVIGVSLVYLFVLDMMPVDPNIETLEEAGRYGQQQGELAGTVGAILGGTTLLVIRHLVQKRLARSSGSVTQ